MWINLNSQYLVDIALRRDFKASENDWRLDGPALSWHLGEDWFGDLLQQWNRKPIESQDD